MLSRIRLRTKLILSFLIVLVLLVIASGLAYKQFITVGHEVEEYAHVVEGAAEASHIEARFLKLRTHAREYAVTAQEADAQAVHNIASQLIKDLKQAINRETDPTHLSLLKTMQKDAQAYLADFDKVEKLEHAYLDLVKNRMMPKGAQMSAELDQVLQRVIATNNGEARTLAEEAIQHTYMARLYSNLLIGNKDETVGDAVKAEFAKLHQTIKQLATSARSQQDLELANHIDELARDYETTLDQVIADTKQIQGLVNGEMIKFAQELITDAEKLQEMAAETEKIIETQTLANIKLGEQEVIIVGSVSFVLGLLIAWFLGGSLARPIQAITRVMEQLAHNNLSVEVPYRTNRDELGEMASSVNYFKEKLVEVKRLEREQQEQKLQAEAQRRVAMVQMADIFESSVGKVVEAVTAAATELHSAANQLATTAKLTSEKATTVSAATEEASSNVQTVASASEELASSNDEIGRNVQHTAQVASGAAQQSHATQETVSSMVDEVGRITSFAELISDIADQTNMLALNATIESARAGEAGKGFAVVASEVKTLAQQTADATEEIVIQIRQINLVTRRAAQEMEKIGQSITETDRLSSSIASTIEEQISATNEIARSVEQAAQGTQQVATNIVMVEHASNETGVAAQQIASSSQDLSKQAEYLRAEVGNFLDNVRASNENKQFLAWNDDFSCGLDIIDNHHKAFFQEMNFYHARMIDGISQEEVDASLSRILAAFGDHLDEEEREMEIAQYPDLANHRAQHREIQEKLNKIAQDHFDGADISLDFFDTLASWLRDHTAKQDLAFAQYLKEERPEVISQLAAE